MKITEMTKKNIARLSATNVKVTHNAGQFYIVDIGASQYQLTRSEMTIWAKNLIRYVQSPHIIRFKPNRVPHYLSRVDIATLVNKLRSVPLEHKLRGLETD